MIFPDYPKAGEPVSAAWARRLLDYLRSITPQSSARCRVNTNSGGTTFEPVAGPATKKTTIDDEVVPFKVFPAGASGGGLAVVVELGIVGDTIPDINGDKMDIDRAKNKLAVDGENCYVVLDVTCYGFDDDPPDGKLPRSVKKAEVRVVEDLTEEELQDYQRLLPLAKIEKADGRMKIGQLTMYSQEVALCDLQPTFGLL